MDTLAERSNSHDSQFVGRDARLNSIYDKYLYDPRDLTSPDPRLRELARKASKLQHAPRSAPAAASADGMSAAQQRKKRQSAIGFAPGTKGGNAGAAPAHRRDDSGGGAWAGFMMGNGAVSDSDSDSDAEADRRRRPPPQKAAEGSRAVAARSAAAEPDVAAAGQRGSWTSRAAAVGSRPPDSASQNPPTLKLLGLKSLKDGGSPIGHSPAAGDSHFAAQQGAPRSTARTPDFEMIAGAEQRDARRNDERTMSASDYGDEVDARHGSTIDFGRAMQRGADEARPSRGVHLSDDGPAPPASSQKGRPVSPRTALTRQLGLVTPMPEQPASMAASGDYFGGGPPAPMSAGPFAPAGYDSRGPPPGSLDSRAPSSAPPHPRTLLPAPSQGPPPPQGRAPPPAQLRAPPPPQQAMRGPPGDRFGGGAPGVPVQRGMPGPPGPGMRGPPSPLGGPQPPPQAMQRGPPPSYGSDPRGMPSPTGPPGGFDRGLAPPGAMRGPPSPRGPPGPGYGPPRGPPVPPAGFAPQGSRPQQPPPAGFSDSRPPQKGAGNVFRRSMAFFGGDGPGPAPRPPNGKRQSAFRRSMAFITGRPMPEPAPAPRPYEDDDANAPQPRVRGFVEEKPKSRKSIFFGASGMGDEWDVSGRGERFWRRFSLAQQVAAKPDATSAAFRAKVRRRQRMVKCLSFLGLLAIIAGIAIVIVWREGKSKTTDIPGSINRAENGGTYTPPSAGVKTRRDTGLYGLPAFPAPTHAPAAALPDLYDVAMGSKRSVPFGDAAGAALARRQQHRRLEHDAAA